MRVYQRDTDSRRRTLGRKGFGVLNTLINKLPVELHIPGYRFCGPGTRLSKRLARGDKGINPLDEACKEHDVAYSQFQDLQNRHEADKTLSQKAWQRFRSKDAGIGEKTAALTIAGIMKGKTKLGMGSRRRRRRSRKAGRKRVGGVLSFKSAVARARNRIRGKRNYDLMKAARLALGSIKKNKINVPKTRIIKIPKTGGILPLIPIFAALSALGSLGGGAAAIAKAVGDAKAATKDLKEKQRHNQAMESLKIGGKGLRLAPYKQGFGIFFDHYQPSKN